MKNFQTVVQELLHNHERQRRYIALLTALCMLMAFTVSIILIEPAESMTGELACGMSEHIHNENCFTYTCGQENDENHVHSAECRKLICEQTEHAHSENCYIHEDEPTAQIMQIDEPAIFDDGIESSLQDDYVRSTDTGQEEQTAQSEKIIPISGIMAISGIPWFTEVQEQPPVGAVKIPKIDSVSITINDKTYTADGSKDMNITSTSDILENISFVLNYTLNKQTVTKSQPYIYYKLPDGVEIPKGLSGENCYVTDAGVTVGYFSISENGLIVIRFNEDYITEKINTSTDPVTGRIEFKANIKRENNAIGDRELNFEGKKFNIQFPNKTAYDLEKSGRVIPGEDISEPVEIEWTIEAISYGEAESFEGFSVTDDRFPEKHDLVTITPPVDGSWSEDGKTFTFSEDAPEGQNTVTFKFRETISDEEFNEKYGKEEEYSVTNNAKLFKDTQEYPDKAEVKFTDLPSIQKHGDPVYTDIDQNGNGKIRWTILVKHPYAESLLGYYIEDNCLTATNIVSVKNKKGEDVAYSVDGHRLTFEEGKADASLVTVIYETDANLNGNTDFTQNNTANLYSPSGTKQNTVTSSATYQRPYQLKDKSGTYDYVEEKITWTVGASVTDKNEDNLTLNGYYLEDDAFVGLDLTTVDITATNEKNQYLSVDRENSTKNQLILSNGAILKLEGNRLTVEGNLHDFTMTYLTDPDNVASSRSAETDDSAQKLVRNTVTDKLGNSKTGEVDVTPRDVTTKTLVSSPDSEITVLPDSSESIQKQLTWEINIVNDKGFDGTELTDTVNASVSGSNHAILPETIKVQARVGKNYSWHDLKIDEDYEVQENSNQSFTLKFLREITQDGSSCHNIKITYSSQITIDAPNSDSWDFNDGKQHTFTFTNEVTGVEQPYSWDYTVKNKNYVENFNLTVSKTWTGNSAPPTDSIEIYLRRRLGKEGIPKIIYYNETENKWEEFTETEENIAGHTYKLSSSNYWQETWNNLPKDTTDHNADYYYDAVEVTSLDDYNVKYSDLANASNPNFSITNAKPADYAKYIIKKDGTKLGDDEQLTLKDLQKVTFAENEYTNTKAGEYYLIKYRIEYTGNGGSSGEICEICDKIPDPFTLVYWSSNDTRDNGKIYHPEQYYKGGGHYTLVTGDTTSEQAMNYNESTKELRIGFSDYARAAEYYIMIPTETLEGLVGSNATGYVVKNTISMKGAEPYTREVTIKGNSHTGTNVDNSLLSKHVTNDYGQSRIIAAQGNIEYYVYANPTGRDLSNTDEYDINDNLLIQNWSDLSKFDADALVSSLFSIKVEEVTSYLENSDGTVEATVGRTLQPGEYQYQVEYEPITRTVMQPVDGYFEYAMDSSDLSKIGFGWSEKTDKVTVKMKLQAKDAYKGKTITFIADGKEYSVTFDDESKAVLEFELNVTGQNSYTGSFSLKYGDTTYDYNNVTTILRSHTIESVTTEKTINSHSAKLTITVPDEKPLKITYSYHIDGNKGELINPETKELIDELTFDAENEISLNTGNVSSYDDTSKSFEYSYSHQAEITTGNSPKIVKYNVGNIGENLSATFYIAEYDGQWKFPSSEPLNDEVKDETGKTVETRKEFTFDLSAANEEIPDGAKAFDVTSEPYKLNLESGKLYKIIEVKVPNNDAIGSDIDRYEANDAAVKAITDAYNAKHSDSTYNYSKLEDLLKDYLKGVLTSGSPYQDLLNQFVYVHYFKYGDDILSSTPSNYSAEIESKVISVESGGTLGIPNNELIDITVSKTWDSDVENPGDIKVELWWSYYKNLNVDDPDFTEKAQKLSTENNLGVTNQNFEPVITIKDGKQVYTWNNLPNGTADKPIYYYVRETEYTIDGVTYTRNNDGGFTANDITGDYKQVYTNNGINKDGTVKIKNTKGLIITKVWQTADKKPLLNIPVESVKFELYGLDADGKETLLYTGTLTKAANWKMKIPATVNGKNLADYSSLWVKETTSLYSYVIDYSYNMNDTVGEITITNRSNISSEISATVNKVWGDGAEKHNEQSIKVKLYRANNYLTSEQLKQLEKGETLEGVTLVSDKEEVILNAENSWSYTWNNLPYNSEDVAKYFYYAVETQGIDGYSASYTRIDQTTQQHLTITNSIPGLTIVKQWQNTEGNTITEGLPDSIDVKLYRRAKTKINVPDELKNKELKVMGLGDSITDDYNVTGSWRRYFYDKMENLYGCQIDMVGTKGGTVTDGDLTWDNENVGHQGFSISSTITGRTGILEAIDEISGNSGVDSTDLEAIKKCNPDVVILLIGTNDLLDHYNISSIGTRLKELTDEIYRQKENVKLFIMTPPPINPTGTNSNWINSPGTLEADFTTYNTAISELVKQYQSEGKECELINIYEMFMKHEGYDDYSLMLADCCHPNQNGYEAMGNYIAEELIKSYGGTIESNTPENTDSVPNDLTESEFVQECTIKKSDGWVLNLPDLEISDGKGNEYVYYVVEETTGESWQVSYNGNGKTVSGSGSTVTVTNTMETIGLKVTKDWGKDTPPSTLGVNMEIHRSTTPPTGQKLALGVQPSEEVVYNESGAIVVGYGGKLKLQANQANVKYSSDASFVTINDDGEITIGEQNDSNEKGDTEVTITITSENGKESKTIKLLVTNKLLVNPNSVTLAVDQSVTLKANKTVSDVTKDNDNVDVTSSGEEITVTGKTIGTTTLTVHSGDEECNVSVNVVAGLSVTPDRDTVVEGESFTVTPNRSDAVLSFNLLAGWYVNGNTITVGEITGESQTATITATDDNMKDTATFSVTVNDFQIQNGEEFTLSNENGKTLNLTTNHTTADGSIKWSSDNDKITVNSSGVVSCSGAVGGDFATIKAEYTSADGKVTVSDIVTVTIVEAVPIEINGYSGVYSGDTVVFELNEKSDDGNYRFTGLHENELTKDLIPYKAEIELSQEPENQWWSNYYCWLFGYNNSVGIVNGKILTFTANTPTSFAKIGSDLGFSSSIPAIKIIIYVRTATSGDSTAFDPPSIEDIAATPQPRTISITDPTYVTTIKLTGTGGWTEAEDLPMYDESGTPYYYWIVESADSAAGYDVTYQYFDGDEQTEFDDTAIDAEKAGDAKVVVTNTKTESSTTTMPSTGGTGARKYYTVGGMLLMLSACGWAMRRRKRVIPH